MNTQTKALNWIEWDWAYPDEFPETGYYQVFAPDYFDSEQGVAHWNKDKKSWSTTYNNTVGDYINYYAELPQNP